MRGCSVYKMPAHNIPLYYRFVVRDFQYNEEEMKADKEEMNRLSTDKKKQFVSNAQYTVVSTDLIVKL